MKKTLLLAFILLATLMVHADYQSSGGGTAQDVICTSPCIDISGETNLASGKGVSVSGDTVTAAFVGAGTNVSAGQTCTDATWKIIPFTDAEEAFDSNAFHTEGTSTTRFTIPTGYDGKYFISGYGYATASGATTGQVYLQIYKNGTGLGGTQQNDEFPANSSFTYNMNTATIISLVATDYVEVAVHIDGASASYDCAGAIRLHYLGP